MEIQVQPIKQQVIQIGSIRDGAANTGDNEVVIRFTTPSRRIHWTLQIGWTGDGAFTTAEWALYPIMVDPVNGSEKTRVKPVVPAGTTLPDGYEAESGVKEWEAVLTLASNDTVPARIFAVICWEPSVIEMCEQERAYWASLCTAARVTPVLDIGASP